MTCLSTVMELNRLGSIHFLLYVMVHRAAILIIKHSQYSHGRLACTFKIFNLGVFWVLKKAIFS